jgi:predicted enzyme related to lactoylglutathione lyase
VAAVKESGGKIVNGPMEVPGGDVIAQGIDPQGAMFALHAKAKKAS